MTVKALKDVQDRVETWPQEDQDALAEYAWAAVRKGLEQAQRGEFVSDEDMDKFWKSSSGA